MKLPKFAIRWISRRCLKATRREPDFVIKPDGLPYLYRWHIVRHRWFGIYLHLTARSDEGRWLHDHPWHNISIILDGSYIEHVGDPQCLSSGAVIQMGSRPIVRTEGDVIFRPASMAHRLEIAGKHSATTLFIIGPRIRTWGFWTPKGWLPFDQVVEPDNPGKMRREYLQAS